MRRGYPDDEVHKWLKANLTKRWNNRLAPTVAPVATDVLVLKTQYNLAWNYFNAHELGDEIMNYWREWLRRADAGDFNSEFPAPDPKDYRVAGPEQGSGAAVDWDLRKTDIFNAKVILSRKKTRNFLDVSNLWKRTVLSGIEGQALAAEENFADARVHPRASLKRPFIPDVNTQVVGRRAKAPRVSQNDDDEHIPVHRRYPSPTATSTVWQSAAFGTWSGR
jgi:hypothetical protein